MILAVVKFEDCMHVSTAAAWFETVALPHPRATVTLDQDASTVGKAFAFPKPSGVPDSMIEAVGDS